MDHFTSTPQPGVGATNRHQVALVHGHQVSIGGAEVHLEDDVLRWSRQGAAYSPGATSGVASTIVDALLGVTLDPLHAGMAGHSDAASERERAIPVDQTNTSVIVDDRWVVKIVGSWGVADRSASILEQLNASGSAVTPGLLGVLEWEHPERGRSVLALVAEYVPDSDDGWTWAVDEAVSFLAGSAEPPSWPSLLGSLTAAMHTALRVTGESTDPRGGDRERAAANLERAFALIDGGDARRGQRPAGFDDRLRARREALAAAIDTIPARSAAPLITPHGDFHVGQILRTADHRYFVLDFDGDPQWDAEQRGRSDGTARDVAHMLVSIDLVAAVAQRRGGRTDERAWEWGRAAQRSFLDAYLAHVTPGFLDEAALPGLMAEQLLAEISYAESYLPEWRYAPDGVISRRYPRADALNDPQNPDETELPWTPPALPMT